MKEKQTSITVSGNVAESIRALVVDYPGSNANRIGRALLRLGLQQAGREPTALVTELRALDEPFVVPGERNSAPVSHGDLKREGGR